DRVITGERRSAGAHHVRAGDVERAVQIYRRATDFKVARAGDARTGAQIVRARSEKVQRRVRANFKTSRRVATVQLHCAAQQLPLAAVVKQIGEGGFSTDLVNDAIRVDRAGPTQHEREAVVDERLRSADPAEHQGGICGVEVDHNSVHAFVCDQDIV